MPYDFSNPIEFRNAGAGGQYGYVDGLPVLNASIADSVISANNGYVTGDAAGRSDNAMGWDTGSVNGVLTSGAGVYGIRRNQETDSESGQPTGQVTYSGDMDAAARQLGLNVTGLNDEQKYNLINNATKDLYLVSGKTGRDAGGVGEQYEGRTQTAAVPGATTNHATVLYRREGDALVPISQTAQYYNGEMELSPGSGLSDFISFAAPIALMAFPGAGTALGTALGATGATASALGGAIIGGGLSAATGGNVLQGAALGGLGGYAGGGGFSAGQNAGNALSTLDEFGNHVQVFDDGSRLVSNANWQPISGIDATGQAFNVGANGVATYADGSRLGGTPELNFGGNLANPTDVQNLLDYNASVASSGATDNSKKLVDAGKKIASLLTNDSASGATGSNVGTTAGGSNLQLAALVRGNQNPFNFGQTVTQAAPVVAQATQPTYLGQLANLLKG